MADSIKIVVRVRPFNPNEQGQSNIVEMDDQQVRLNDPQGGQVKKFAFHRCYWSTDNSLGKPPVNNMFVFNDIGKQILGHIYQGYNSTVFAYGQTGSGKSYSIQGYQEKGILQLCLEDIFQRKKKQNDAQGISTQVKVTYLQIYNQKLRDLLNPNQKNQIKVQSAGTAVFISGVDPVLCQSYDQVLKMFQDGKKIRVIGAHAMNKNSSRSHAVFTIFYKQVGKGKAIQAKFNIVDLAGSQRQSKTGATGVRLQQANNINKSLTNLGIVIQTLANNCLKKQTAFVPYRNSLLTHILSQSLGGNSKTFMIAAISPASSNYQQTLSTLRFAQRASMITTQSKKNVQQKQGYNKQLLQQIQRLRKQLQNAQGKVINTHTHSHSVNVQYITMQDQQRITDLQTKINIMLQQLQKNKSAMQDLQKQLEEQRKKKLQMQENRKKALKQAGLQTQKDQSKQKLPYLMNISQDPTLAGMLIYHIKQGQITIGTSQAQQNDIKLNALGIMKRHCTIIHKDGKIFIEPKQDCRLYINGLNVIQKKQIKHLDRITLGHANTFKLIIPGQKVDLLQSVVRYGQFLDDRLNSQSQQSKNTKIFLQELQQRLDKDTFARFLQKFKNAYNDIDQANDYTIFRYKKYPLKNRNIQFRLNVIIDIQNYLKGQPSLIILCQHKQTNLIQFIWSQQKFQARLAEMQTWYADVSGGSVQSDSTFYQFDPWFDASDNFIKQKQHLQIMNAKQIHQFWVKKQTENSQLYKQLLQQQKQILAKLGKQGANAQLIEDYGDYYFRGYDIPNKNKQKCQKLRKNQQAHKLVKRFMQCCAQIQKCNLDNKAFNQSKNKYIQNNNTQKNTKNNDSNDIQALSQENVWLTAKIEQLQNQLRRKTKELNDQKKRNGR